MHEALTRTAAGDTRANISRRVVQLHKEHLGKGPTRARTHVVEDTVVVILGGGFTTLEETMRRAGRSDEVIAQRQSFQAIMSDRFVEIVEQETGRRVAAFMSASHQDPDYCAEIFVLEPAGPG